MDLQPLLSTKTIHVFYRPLAEHLVRAVKALPAAVRAPADGAADSAVGLQLERAAALVRHFDGLLTPSKVLDRNAAFLAQILKLRCA